MEDFIKAVKEDLTERLSDLYPGIQVEQTYVEKAHGGAVLRRTGAGGKERPSGKRQVHPLAGCDHITRRKDTRLIEHSWL